MPAAISTFGPEPPSATSSGHDFIMNLFLNACGISGPLQIALRGPNPSENGVRMLHQPFALVGRDQRSDMPLDHRLVSRRHVYLQVVEGQAFWIDLESRSGTLEDGQPGKSGWLGPGRVIRIGPFELQRLTGSGQIPIDRSSTSGEDISPLIARSHSSQPLPDVTLEFLNGPSRSTCWPMNRVMSLIGSAGGCKFRLADPSVAPFHCSMIRTPLGLWAVDLLGPDGIGVNDTLVRHALLADNDVLKIGRYRIRICCRFPGRDADGGRDPRGARLAHGDTGRHSRASSIPVAIPEIGGLPDPGLVAWSGSVSRSLSSLRAGQQASQVEWIPPASLPGSGETVRLDNGELADSVLVPLVNQFGLMQQQMMDQFQQTIAMLVQMFGSLQRDQMDLIREELDQLRDLTKEFQAIKVELAERSQVRDPAASPERSAAPVRASEPSVDRDRRVDRGPSRDLAAGAAKPRSAAGPSTDPQANDMKSHAPRVGHAQQEAVRDTNPTPRPHQNRAEADNQDADRDVIVWLHQRMMTLQQERETRWQKILKLLPGLS